MTQRRALVTGASGQTGSYMVDLLLEKGYTVFAGTRRTSTSNTERLAHCLSRITLLPMDLTDSSSLEHALYEAMPHEVYNFAAQSFVAESFATPLATSDVTGLGALRLFEAVRNVCPTARVYQASSSEMFGNSRAPQSETTPFAPVSPYAAAKTFAHYCAQVYRRAYRMYIACGICFNHESERRGEEFVTRKISKAVAAIKTGQQPRLVLGNLAAMRDWCHAEDVVRGAWAMLQEEEAADYVLASGKTHSVQEFVARAFDTVGLTWGDYVDIDPQFYRPAEVNVLCGDATKARSLLNWRPRVSFEELVARMVGHDLAVADADLSRARGARG